MRLARTAEPLQKLVQQLQGISSSLSCTCCYVVVLTGHGSLQLSLCSVNGQVNLSLKSAGAALFGAKVSRAM